MRILYLSDVYFPRVNGVSTSIHTFVQQLNILDHEVDLIAPSYDETIEDEAWVSRIPSRKLFFDPEDRLMKYGDAVDQMLKIRKGQYDLVHIHTPFAVHYLGRKLAKHHGIPCVETYHTFFEDYLHHYLPLIPKGVARSIAKSVSRRQCDEVDAIITPSQPMLEVLRSYGVETPIEVIPTGMDAESFADADGEAFRRKYQIPPDKAVLLYVGRLAFEKNIDFLLRMKTELLAMHSDALLIIAGEGPAEESLRQSVAQLNLQNTVMFLGNLDRATELRACYKAADIFVFASKSETQGLVLLEAMAQGTPVVAIAELGTKSILIEGEGALIAPENETCFAEKVYRLLMDKRLRQELSARAVDYTRKHWTAQAHTLRLVRFYQSLLASERDGQEKTGS